MIPALDEASLREPLRRLLGERDQRKLPKGGTAAAVLVPLFERDGEAHLWLARRPQTMRSHAGQVAFPGGKSEREDESLLATALRETHEELGIDPSQVDVLGGLDDVFTITGFTISPWVGWVAPGTEPQANPAEVARVFAAPLRAFFEEPTGVLPFRGWTVDGELVWGATAAILRGFVMLLEELPKVAQAT